MLPITHLLAPVVALEVLRRRTDHGIDARHILLAGAAGILPDLVNLHIALAERASYSHSLLIVPLLLTATLLAGRYRSYMAAATAGIGSHILLDILSAPYNFLYPLSFQPAYPALNDCGLQWWICWYTVDVLLVIALVLLVYASDAASS